LLLLVLLLLIFMPWRLLLLLVVVAVVVVVVVLLIFLPWLLLQLKPLRIMLRLWLQPPAQVDSLFLLVALCPLLLALLFLLALLQ
jgi:hypothetical protein